MKSIRTSNSFAKFVLTLLVLASFAISNLSLAEGTPQASPTNSANGASLLSAPDLGAGPYRNAPNENRVRFTISNNASENLYFGFMPRTYDNNITALKDSVFYRIFNAAGVQVAGPTLIPIAAGTGFIANYAQATAGPNIGGATPTGYTPFLFDPTTNGDFYIELYNSLDNGATAQTGVNGRVTFPFFDFTVATTANVKFPGRIWSREWSFVTTNLTSANFPNALTSSFTGDFFAYTPDQFKIRINFEPGFRPLAYQLAANFGGIGSSGNFVNDRRSVNNNISVPNIVGGYQVFLQAPDNTVFPNGTLGSPAIASSIYGCPGNYFIPYYLNQPGDVSFLLDLNGVPGFQASTADRRIEIFGAPAGNQVLQWDGLNGLGAPVNSLVNTQVTLVLYQGRTNLPMIDAELNSNGLSVTGIFPATGNRRLYWDDTQLTAFGTCVLQTENSTTGGVAVTALNSGVFGPTHAYDGSNPTTTVPAPIGGQGSSTINALCDDYGNNRTINTWFYATELSTSVISMVTPSCDKDNDGIADATDIDDDNDGILDVIEFGALPNPMADADGDNIPNYIDPSAAGFVDTNFDGVDDRYDFDLDGNINQCDLDSDNDGIPDNIEAQTTLGYVAPAGADADGDGLDNAYETNGLTPVNTDGTDNPDYLDLNSDNEGANDTGEAGITLTGLDTDNDGLDNATDATVSTGFGDPNGSYDNWQYDNFPDTDGDVLTGGDVNWRDATLNDFDNDGLPDNTDLDDDNDGILDSVEGVSCATSNWGTAPWLWTPNTNSGTITNITPGTNMSVNIVPSPNGTTNVFGGTAIDPATTGLLGGISDLGVYFDPNPGAGTSPMTITLNFTNPVYNGSFFITDIDGGGVSGATARQDRVTLSSNVGTPILNIPAGVTPIYNISGTVASANSPLINSANNNTGSVRVIIPNGATQVTILYEEISGASDPTGRGIGILGNFSGCTYSDFDNDGVPNYHDWDSDNDGIYDVTEAGGVDSDNNGTANDDDNNVNNTATNGIPTSAGAGTTPLDFGSNGTPNYLNLDSDADGCNDVIEAGFTDQNSNGILGNNPTVVNANGVVTGTSVTNGYTGTNANVTTPGSAGTISSQPANVTVGTGGNANFSVTATGTGLLYQWQISTNGGSTWTNLANGGTAPVFANVTSSTLSLTNIPNASNNNQFRVIITNPSYLCATLTSNAAILTVDPTVNLQVTKTVSNPTPVIGTNVTFTIVAENLGTSNATAVNVNDLLPTGYSFVSSTVSVGTYNSGTGVWNIGNLPVSTPQTLTITATVLASGNYLNTATISGNQTDPVPGNNISSISTTPISSADVAISKTVDNATPNVGSVVTFTVTATNAGPSPATSLSISDALPTGYTLFGTPTASVGTYNSGTGIWSIPTLAASGSATLTIQATVLASGNYANTATYTPSINTPDPNSSNNSSTSTPSPVAQANLAVVKTASTLTPNVGTNITFTITATNSGPSNATGVLVTDLLPAGYTFVSATPSTGTYASGTGIWNINTLNPGPGATLTIVATVNATGPYQNCATIDGAQGDPVSANDQSCVTPTPAAVSDLTVVKTASSNTPDVGSILTFTIDATNNGPSPATAVNVTDLLPAGYSYISFTSTFGSYNPITGVWNINNLASGVTQSLFIQAAVNPAGPYQNCATIAGSPSQTDPNAANNTSCTTPVPVPQTNLGVVKTATPSNPNVGGSVVFTITANNAGPSPATNVIVTDSVPAGYTISTLVPPNPSVGTYNPVNGQWIIGSMAANGTNPTLTITATVNATGSYANTACINGNQIDPTPGNNCSTVIPGPTPQANVSIVKTANTASPLVGGTINFTLTASNTGPSDATQILVTDLLPAGYTYVTHATAQGSYDPTSGQWTSFNLPNGSTATLTIAATVNPTGPYQNCAVIDAFENDPSLGNNTSCTTPVPVPQTDLSITKSVNNLTPNVGSTVTFTLTAANAGPSNATSVVVNDLLPAGYTFQSAVPAVQYNATTGVWTVGGLNSGANSVLTITALVNATGSYQNCASISAATADPNNANNNACVTPVPVPQTDLSITKTASSATPPVGGIVSFTLTATNAGPSQATNVVVNDLLPAGYTFSSASPLGVYNAGTGVWTINTLNSGANSVLTINAIVNAAGPYQNCASISGSTSQVDPNSANNSACTTPVPVPQADLSITKSVNVTNPTVGTNVVFTVTLTNNGPSSASSIVVTDLLPSGYSFVNSTVSTGTYNNGTGIWDNVSLTSTGTATLTIEATVLVSGNYTNTASITSSGVNDPILGNNSASASPVPSALSNLIIGKTVNISSPAVGSNVIFTLTATNVGPSDATTVNVTDLLPSGYTFVSFTSTQGNYSSGVWSIGSLPNGISQTLNITATVNAAGAYQNCATIAGDQTDPVTANNNACVSTTPIPNGDGFVIKTVSNLTPNVNGTVVFTIVAGNNGPSNISGVLVNDLLPTGYTYVSHTVTAGTYNPVNGNWLIGILNNGITRTLTITATVNATGNYQNCAAISSNQVDPNSANNISCATPVPVPISGLSVVKTVSPANPLVGSNVNFTITVSNAGPSQATGVQVTDLLPTGYTFVSSSSTNYDNTTGIWNIGTVNVGPGNTVSLTITATVLASGTYVNTATVDGNEVDPNPGDDISSIAPTPIPLTDLGVTKDVDNNAPSVGDTITFAVVAYNFGPSPATSVSVYDTIPSGYAIVAGGVTTTQGTYSQATGTWTVGTMLLNDTDTMYVTAVVLPTGLYTNTATITGAQVDPNTSNNISTSTPGLVNLPPVAVNDTASGVEDNPITVNVVTGVPGGGIDTDVDGIVQTNSVDLNPLSGGIQSTATTSGGNWSTAPNGVVTFTPNVNFTGTDSLTYTVLDDDGFVSNVATIYVTLTPVNDPPVVFDDNFTINEDSPLTNNLLTFSADNDPDGSQLLVDTIPVFGPTSGGTFTTDTLGNFTYTPPLNFVGVDTIVVTVCDQGIPLPALCTTDTLFITVLPVNDPPVAVDDDTTTLEDNSVTINILLNDFDVDGTLLPQTIDLDPSTPTVLDTTFTVIGVGTWSIIDTNGTIIFVPAPNFNGTASTPYNVCDNNLQVSNTAVITIVVTPVNDTVSQGNETWTVAEDSPSTISPNLLLNNVDIDGSVVIVNTAGPSTQGVVVTINPGGTINYAPPANFTGIDTIVYEVCDNGIPGPGICVFDTLFINVTSLNDAPIANQDISTTPILEDGTGATIPILINDTDIDGNPVAPTNGPGQFTVDLDTILAGPQTSFTNAAGQWTYNPANGLVSYVPATNFNGTATIVYELCDAGALCDTSLITFTVLPVNDTPVVVNESYTTLQGDPILGNVLTNDSDVDGNLNVNVLVSPISGPQVPGATFSILSNGDFTYVPPFGFVGNDQVVVSVCDDGSPTPIICVNDTIFITVNPSTPPVAVSDDTTTLEDTQITFNITDNDTDADGFVDSSTVVLNQPSSTGGTWTVNNQGDVTFDPPLNGTGPFSINYTVLDDDGAISNSGTITVNVVPVNDPPVVDNEYPFTAVNVPVGGDLIDFGDSDVDGNLTATTVPVSGPFFGSITIDSLTGVFTYTPNPGYVGPDIVVVSICDDGTPLPSLCTNDTIFITVTATVPPVAINDTLLNCLEDNTLGCTINISGNDTDIDGVVVPSTIDLDPSTPATNNNTVVTPQGTWSVNAFGTLTFIPASNYCGPATLTYTIDDNNGATSNIATVVVEVTCVNDAPTTTDVTVQTPINTPIGVNVAAGSTDPENNPLTYTYTFPVVPAGVIIDTTVGNGVINVTPPAPFVGTITIPFTVCDASPYAVNVLCTTGVITIQVIDTTGPGNNAPIANNDEVTVPFGTTDVVVNPLANDSDVDGDQLTVTVLTPITSGGGSAAVNLDGTVDYTANPSYIGQDSIQYVICDTGSPVLCDTAWIYITISPVVDEPNVAPVATDDYVTVSEDSPVVIIPVLTNDSDPNGDDILNPVIISGPGHGTANVNPADGTINYDSDPGYNGPDTITYVICDNGSPVLCDTAQVIINVSPINDGPSTNDVTVQTPINTPVGVNVAAGSSDPENNPLTYTYTFPVIPAGVIIDTTIGNGVINVTPPLTFVGTITIPFTVCDNSPYPVNVLCTTGVITVQVIDTTGPGNNDPIANNDQATVPVGTPSVVINPLANDFDVDGDFLDVNIPNGTTPNGTFTETGPNELVTYVPNPGFTGEDSVLYVLCDNATPQGCDSAWIYVTISPVVDEPNVAPVATDDYVTVGEDSPGVIIPVLTNDSDPDGDLIANPTIVSGPNHGNATPNANGTITYVPDPNYNGPDTITYVICDNGSPVLCDTAQVIINVSPINDGPSTNDVTVQTPINTPVGVNVAAGSSDPENNPLTYTYDLSLVPTDVTVDLTAGNGVINVIPTNGYTGPFTIPFTVCDNSPYPVNVLCTTGVITVQVIDTAGPGNNDPIANNDQATVPVGTPSVVINPLANDFDVDGDILNVAIPNGVTPNGTFTVTGPNGLVTYIPTNPGFTGEDSVMYQLCDNATPQGCDSAWIYVTISPVVDEPNVAPVATDDYVTVNEDAVDAPIVVLTNDSDPDGDNITTTVISVVPQHGDAIIDLATGNILYTPDAGFVGEDSLTYVICDNGVPSLCDTAVVYINILPGNDGPSTTDITVVTSVDVPVGVNVAAGSTDPENNPLTYTYDLGSVPVGNVTVDTTSGNGVINVIPTNGYTGTFTIPFTVCDESAFPVNVLCTTGVITVIVVDTAGPGNNNPIANNDLVTVPFGTTDVTVNPLANDFDVDGDPLTVTVLTPLTLAGGSAAVDPIDGTIDFTPNPTFVGTDSIQYMICDGVTAASCDTAWIYITISPVVDEPNVAPVATNDYETILVDSPGIDIFVLTNDSDPDGNDLGTPTVIDGPNHGTIIQTGDTINYEPTLGFVGLDSFTYVVCDNGTPSLCDTAVAYINVLPINLPPVAVNNSTATNEDVPVDIAVLVNDTDPDGNLNPSSVDLNPSSPGIQDTFCNASGCWEFDTLTGLVTFTPVQDSCGYTGTITYVVSDSLNAVSNVATISVLVLCVNDGPVAAGDSLVTFEDVPLTNIDLELLTDDVDDFVDPATYDLIPGSGGFDNTFTNSGGTWSVSPTGILTFTPVTDSCNYDAVLTYTVNDINGLTSNIATIVISVLCVNDAPTTWPVTVLTPMNTPVGVNVAAGSSDPENNPLTYTYTFPSLPVGVIIDTTVGNGVINVTPPTNFVGTIIIPFIVCDSSLYDITSLCDTDTIYVTVIDTAGPGNNAPIANNDLVTMPYGTPNIFINPLANDYDVDGDVLDVTIPIGVTPHGTFTVTGPNELVTYVPNPGFIGEDSVFYVLCDNATPPVCDTGWIYVTVSPIVDTSNVAPVATDDYVTVDEDAVDAPINVLVNDSDPNGDLINDPTIFIDPDNGTASVDPVTGNILYTPDPGFVGEDSLTYVICDNGSPQLCDTAVVYINVLPGNNGPSTTDITVSTSVDIPVGVNTASGSSDPENNPLTFTYNFNDPSIPAGTLFDSTGTGTFTITPAPGWTGTFTIPFTVCDSSIYETNVLCTTGTITVIVVDTTGGNNEDPIANNDLVTTPINTSVVVNPLGNDFDPNGDPLDVTVSSPLITPHGGTVVLNPNGTVSYTPLATFTGIDSIQYVICDGVAGNNCDTAYIIITVSPVVDTNNVAPSAADDYAFTTINVPVTYPVVNNDSDPNGNGLGDPIIVSQGSNGTGLMNPGTATTLPTITYTPTSPTWFGVDTITYVICDNGVPPLCDTALYIITVINPNSAPSNGNETLTVSQCDSLRNINVLGNNVDPDADSMVVSSFSATSAMGGVVTFSAGTGFLNYVPPAGYVGADTVIYTVCDTFVPAGCVQDTIFITVLPDNDCDGTADPIDIDDDNDGILDVAECATANGACDTDGDGIPDYFDLDSDNDGIPDIVESGAGQFDTNGDGIIDSNIDTDNDGLIDVADPNAGGVANPNPDFDGDNRPDFQDLDSDDDGISDVTESGGLDADNNGLLDTFVDANNDGMDDTQSISNPLNTDGSGNPDYIDLDADNDGISDILESGQPDTNGDGQIDAPANADVNNDGLADSQVGVNPQDFDNDGFPNYIDLDSDSDGIPDVIENGYADTDQDGLVDNYTDANNNGWNDSSEATPLVNSDTDPLPDYLDHDSDQDGIPDVVEGGQSDVDMDGWLDDLTDADGNGQADNTQGDVIFDWDNDGTYDYLDLDTDGDGIPDVIEGGFVDANNDSIVDNFNDPDNDGWDNGGIDWTVPDTDGDGIPDFRDIDSDGDGIPDEEEYGDDCDNDGIDDFLDADPCLETLEIPDGFTPNGDGSNDTFIIPGIERFAGNELIIYNRWGNIVFSVTDYTNDWTGTTNSNMVIGDGDELPTGTYYYVFDTKDVKYGENGVVTGFIYIQR